PVVEAGIVMRHLDPEHAAATAPHGVGEAVDRRHDVARRRHHRMADRVVHEGVLQIDDDERGTRRVERGKAVFAAAALNHAADDLGAANLAGYLAGALGARAMAARTGAPSLLRGSMLLTAASLFACTLPFGFAWYFVWRFLSGGTGGVLMALAAPSVLPGIPA